jgi:hypothetical protein
MGSSRAEIEELRRLVDRANDQVKTQAEMIARMKQSGLPTDVAEEALRILVMARDQLNWRLRNMDSTAG